MMQELAKLLRARDIPFDGADRTVMCFPHMINICCQHVISRLTNIELSESADDFIADELSYHPQQQTFEEAVKQDPVALGRNIVRTLRSSGQRRDSFEQLIRDGNNNGWFGETVEQLQLLWDVKTRWDLVYFMLRRLRELRLVRYLSLFTCSFLMPIGIAHRSFFFVTSQP
jgi:hypothetical protein